MRRAAIVIGAASLASALAWLPCPVWAHHAGRAVAPKGPLNTLNDVRRAIRGCWEWPIASAIRTGMEFTIMLSFKRNGEIFGARITYQSRDISLGERDLYYGALMRAIALCSPLPLSPSLGEAIAGLPMRFHFRDSRKQKEAFLHG